MYEDQLRRALLVYADWLRWHQTKIFRGYLDERWRPKAAKGSDHVGIFETDRWLLSIEWKKRESRKISVARLSLHVHLSKHPLK